MKRSFFVILCLLMVTIMTGCWSWLFFVDQPSSVDEGASIDIYIALHAAPNISGMYTPVFCTALPDDWSAGSISYSFRSSYLSTAIPSTLFAAPDESADMNSDNPVSTGGVLSTWNCYAGLYTNYTGVEVWDINIDAQVGSAGAYTAYYAAYSTDGFSDLIEKRTVVGDPAGPWYTWETVNILPDQENRPVPDMVVYDIAYGSGVYVAALYDDDGYEGGLLTAIGGESWLMTALQTHDNVILSVNYSGGYFLATSPDDGLLWMSSDGITWTTTDPGIIYPSAAAYSGSVFVVVGYDGETAWSSDGSAWSVTVGGSIFSEWYEVVYGGGRFVAAGIDADNAMFMTSTDGQAWTSTTLGDIGSSNQPPFTGIAYGSGKYYAALGHYLLFSSNDGSIWETHSLSENVVVSGVAYGDNVVMTIGINENSEGLVFTSTDGETWTTHHPGTGEWLLGITYGDDDRFYIGGTSLLLIRDVDTTGNGDDGGNGGGNGGFCSVTAADLDEPTWPGALAVTLMAFVLYFMRRRQRRNYNTI